MSLAAARVRGDGDAGGIEGGRNGVRHLDGVPRRGLLFYRLIEQAVITPLMTYQQTVRPDLRT